MAKFNVDDYEMVKDRLPLFYDKYNDGRVTTEIYSETENHVTIKASLFANGEDQTKLAPLATGYAREERGGHIDKYTENCETSAIGRSLANLNLYGELAKETGNRPSREEMSAVKETKPLTSYAEDDLKLKKVSAEDYDKWEEADLPYEQDTPKKQPTPRREPASADRKFTPQKQIIADRDSGEMPPIEMPDNFNCPHGYCESAEVGEFGTFLRQVAPSAIKGGIAKRENWDCDIIACRKNGMESVRVDGGSWCNAQWKKDEWFELAKSGTNTDWDNGSKE